MDADDFRSVLYTVDREGRRRWQYVHVVQGFWRRWRRRLSWFLIAFYVVLPFLHIGGERVLHIDIPQRHYVILGHVFWPQDAFFLLLLALMGVIGTLLAVSLFGRVFCGWFCPHNVFLEFVFRPVERLLEGSAPRRKRQDQGPTTAGLALRKGVKYALYVIIAWGLANTFIALFLSGQAHREDFLLGILVDPSLHPAAFIAWIIAAGLILFNFAWFREQTCTIVCPYGRLQAVMLDRDTLTVAYDSQRGEPRGPKKPDQEGDCIDCGLCQVVCPTGL
ncbi:MAG: 4Fe-4S binding protein, partial [Planctomycetota bacterium]